MEVVSGKVINAMKNDPQNEFVTIRITRKAWNKYSARHLSEEYDLIHVKDADVDQVRDIIMEALQDKRSRRRSTLV